MRYREKSFSVPTGKREPKDCKHGWPMKNGRCTFCGEMLLRIIPPDDPPRKEDEPTTSS